MREKKFSCFRLAVAFLMVYSILITSMPLDVNAAQNTSGDQNEQIYVLDGYTVSFKIDTVWNSGYNISVVIQNTGSETISDWYMYLKYDTEITNMWNASVYERISPYMVITNAVWNKDVYPNGTAGFGYTGSGEFPGFPESIEVTSGYEPSAMEGEIGDHGDDDGETSDVDTDGDGLSDTLEEVIGSNPELIDTDEDGLSDYIEYYFTLTSPVLIDTDIDGISDADEDIDEDGLGNLDEINRKTDVVRSDTDGDDLSDFDEINIYGTNPLIPDTDGDGLCDGDDVLLGFSPMMPDTDLNGVLDSDEKIYQTTENNFDDEETHGITSVSVSLNISGNVDKEIGILNGYDFDIQSREIEAIIGVPIDIRSEAVFDEATITFEYDENMLGDTDEGDLSLMWYDEENHWYQILDQDTVVDTQNNTVSYTTTHFSTYLLVDVSKWINIWMEDIDYGDDALITQPPRELDLVYVIDDSQYYSYIDFHTSFMQARKNYNYGNGVNFSGLVDFKEGFSAWYSGDTRYPYKFVFSEDDWRGNPYFGETMDSVLRSIMYCFDHNPELYGNDDKAIVIVSDGNFEIGDDAINECIERGIKIYGIDFEHSEHHYRFKRMSLLTGGQYYYGNILDTPDFLLDCIVYDSHELLNGKDKDGDGLLDVYETEGMRTLTGRLITTDPEKKDTDGDTLIDSEETGPVYDLNLYIGRGIIKNVRFIVPNSDPTEPDSDNDGMTDDIDPYPLKDNVKEVMVHNAYSDIDFLRILSDRDSSLYNGGEQRWWIVYRSSGPSDTEENNMDIRTSNRGCGLIAASNLELFLGQTYGFQPYPYNPSIQFPLWGDNGCISITDYMNFVDYNRENAYFLYDENGTPFGVLPKNLCNGFSNYLTYNGVSTKATWADSTDGKEVLATIKKMINGNLPTICGVCLGEERIPINLYGDLNRAINKDTVKTSNDSFDCNHHYINIIGYIKIDNGFMNYDYYLIVETDTKVYYVDYDSFSNQWSNVMNVLNFEM